MILPEQNSTKIARRNKRLCRFVVNFFLIFALLLQNFLFLVNPVYAAPSPWSQTDWSGGSGQTNWLDATKYSSGSSVTTSTANQATLTQTSSWLNTWAYRSQITISTANVDADLTDYPVLVKLSTSSGIGGVDLTSIFTELGANSLKLAVTASDGITQRYVEVVSWDSTNKLAELWVKVPTVLGTVDTTLYIYYDSTHADNTAYVGATGSTPGKAVWDSNYVLVSHMNDNPDTSKIADSAPIASLGFSKYSSNPVISPTDFDSNGARHSAIYYESGTWYLFYGSNDGTYGQAYRATSTDGITWTKNSTEILTRGGVGTWDHGFVVPLKVLKIGSTYYLWCDGNPTDINSTPFPNGFFTSSSIDGPWIPYVGNPVFNKAAIGQWDATWADISEIIPDPSGVYTWMGFYSGAGAGGYGIGIAYSNDLINWTRYGSNPILINTNYNALYFENPAFFTYGGSSYLVVNAAINPATQPNANLLFKATNADCTTWESAGTLISPGSGWDAGRVGQVSFITVGGVLYGFYDASSTLVGTGGHIGYGVIGEGTDTAVSYNKTAVNNPLEITGGIGKAQNFNGTDSYINVGDNAALSTLGTLTIEAYFNQSSAKIAGLVTKYGNPGSNEWYLSVHSSGVVYGRLISANETNNIQASGSTAISYNTWHYAALTWDGVNATSHTSVYLDGTAETLGNNTKAGTGYAPHDTSIPVEIGRMQKLSIYTFNGKIGEVRISNLNRSAAYIKANNYNFTDALVTYGSTEQQYPPSGTLTSSIFDTEISGGAAWGILTYVATTPTNTLVSIKVRTSNSSSMTGATAFSSCDAVTSGTDISTNNCVTDGQRYAQYQLTLNNTDSISTPTLTSFSLAFEIYDITPPTTTVSPLGGYYTIAQSVSLTCNDNVGGSGCDKTYYTVNGNVPTTGSTEYATPITISATTTLKFFSTDLNGESETVKTETYTIGTNLIIEEQPENANITSWKASEYQKPDLSCQQRLKLEIKGKHFDKNAEVRIGNKEASSVNRKSSKEITAKFCLEKLLNVKTDLKRSISVTNPDADTKKADKKINLGNLTPQITSDSLNTQTVEGVKDIQRALVKLGLLDQRYITGFYGPITTEAVRKFQEQNGIDQTGTVGPITRAKLVEKMK